MEVFVHGIVFESGLLSLLLYTLSLIASDTASEKDNSDITLGGKDKANMNLNVLSSV